MAASIRIRIVNPNVTNSERDVGRPRLPGLGGRLEVPQRRRCWRPYETVLVIKRSDP
jgi:hypothetical protein